MNMKRLIPCFLLTGTLLLGSCENGQMTDMEGQGTELPDSKYPLDFTAVQTAPERTPQTRVSENTDGMSSKWDGGEVINVQIAGGNPGTYTLDVSGKPTAQNPCYWQNTQPATINAWYSNISGQSTETDAGRTVSLSDQSNGLAYVLKATADNVNYKSGSIELKFHHQLAKVRVKLGGSRADKVGSVWVNNYTSCTVTNGDVSADNKDKNYIQMRRNGEYYEANLVPMQAITASDFIRLNDDTQATVSNITQLEAGNVYTITINVKSAAIPDGETLTEAGTYTMQGSYNKGITINGNGITVILNGVNVSTDNIGINIKSGSPTIQVSGASNTITSSKSAGIYVAPGSTVTIKGDSRNDKLTVKGGNGSPGIGGCETGYTDAESCGNIEITKVQIVAYGSIDGLAGVAPGIGGAGNASCGTITIDNATVYAYGVNDFDYSSPAIGGGYNMLGYKGSFGTITIRNGSEVNVKRGYQTSDYIGYSGGPNNPSTGTIIATIDGTSTVTKLN